MDISKLDSNSLLLGFLFIASLAINLLQFAAPYFLGKAQAEPSKIISEAVALALKELAEAERLYTGDNATKKAYVTELVKRFATSQNWNISDELIDVLIEGAVTQFKNAATPHA